MESLLHVGLKIAQSLNLHLLGPETPETPTAGIIRRELGRRIWLCLYIAERWVLHLSVHFLFALASSSPCGAQRRHAALKRIR